MKKINDSSITVKKTSSRNMFILSIIVIAFFLGSVLVFYSKLYQAKKANIIKDGEIAASKSSQSIDKYVSTNMDELTLAAYALDEMLAKGISDEEIQDFLARESEAIITKIDGNSSGLYGYINGKFYSGTYWQAPDDYDATNRPWYKRPFDNPDEVTLLDPYLDMLTNHHMMAVGKVLCDGISVVSMDMDISSIQEVVDETVSSGAADMVIVINDDNLVIAHSNHSEIGRDYDDQRGSLGEMIAHNLENKQNYYTEFKYDAANYFVYVMSIESGLHCISVKNTSDVFSSMKSMLVTTILVVIVSLLVIIYMVSYYRYSKKNVSIEEDSTNEKTLLSDILLTKFSPIIKKLSSKDKTLNLGTRIQKLVFVVLLISESVFCIVAIIQSRTAIKTSVCQRMIDIANCAAGSVDGNVHKRLTARDVDSEEYMQVYNALAVYRDNVELEYVYALRIEPDGRFTYTVDPDVDDPKDFGEEIDYTEGIYKASLGEASADAFRFTDDTDTFYSAYSPIFDSEGNISGIVGVDFSVEWFEKQLNQQSRIIVLLYLIILIITTFFAWMLCFVWIKTITEPLAYMTGVARHYADGDFSETIETETGGEIGVLSHALQVMSGSLQEQIARAEEANKAKSSFLANMSHEIRTPINTVLGMNEMILRESGEKTILYYAQNIKSAGKSLLNLVNDVLDFSKIEAGKIDITPVDYDLSVLLHDLLIMIQSRAFDKGLTFDIKFDPEIPNGLNGDEVRIKQIIINLLSNAVKYTKEGGIVFSVGYRKDENDSIILLVKVSDTGIGIREEDMEKLFSKFERIDVKSNRNIEGTGLGLSITKTLLELMGSTLEVESKYGEGSVFSFELKQKVVQWEPMGDIQTCLGESNTVIEKEKVNFAAPSATILAVDDNPMNLVVFKNLLKHIRSEVDVADGAEEALALLAKKKYDIIFLDHMMPEKDGIETLKELKAQKDNPNLTTPSICLTANAISGAKEYYLSEGFDDYISKPIDIVLLEKCLLQYLPKDKIEVLNEHEVPETDKETVEEGDFLSTLRKKGVLDVDKGLQNNGCEESYQSVLKMYVEQTDKKAAELNRLIEDNNLADYTIQIHALKSSSRIIGAVELGEEAQRLENAAKTSDSVYIGKHHNEFILAYKALKDELSYLISDSVAEEKSDSDKPVADADTLYKEYADMRQAAEDMDIDRLTEIIEDMEQYNIPDEEKQLFEELKEAVDNFDYGSIIKALKDR